MKQAGNLTMSARELDRLEIIGRVAEHRLTQREAAERLGLSLRQVERLCRAFRTDGASGLVSRKRGRRSNRKLSSALRERALDLVRERYADFGPTLACEKLTEQHGFETSRETLRRWMIDAGLWLPRSQRQRRAHQPRHRRSCLGELIQIDGCDHAWFEDRGPKCTPLFLADYNRRFGREPLSSHDAHRPLGDDENLDLIFTWQEERKLSRNLTINYKRVMYLVEPGPETKMLAGQRCRVHEHEDGHVEIRHANMPLPCSVFFDKNPCVRQAAIVANKRLGAVLSKIQRDQQARDSQRLERRNLTNLQKGRIRSAAASANPSGSP